MTRSATGLFALPRILVTGSLVCTLTLAAGCTPTMQELRERTETEKTETEAELALTELLKRELDTGRAAGEREQAREAIDALNEDGARVLRRITRKSRALPTANDRRLQGLALKHLAKRQNPDDMALFVDVLVNEKTHRIQLDDLDPITESIRFIRASTDPRKSDILLSLMNGETVNEKIPLYLEAMAGLSGDAADKVNRTLLASLGANTTPPVAVEIAVYRALAPAKGIPQPVIAAAQVHMDALIFAFEYGERLPPGRDQALEGAAAALARFARAGVIRKADDSLVKFDQLVASYYRLTEAQMTQTISLRETRRYLDEASAALGLEKRQPVKKRIGSR